ncbi:kinase-like protein [Aspergillus eucalypticola CBS 122712]|uniref:Kinase-like protein n=1 Tax=Aspergillus eucalypticola (strain CBS 122712 / IBT 29274) TaxID=1448314 RepID=A0A317VMP9_ASPEC|nr:kinase-like protein [Aspergillus eucalypticola CBS 122712]PWY75624.1 kinase-like protein [Aspergillus eucalypticola CBS 122712]
MASAGLICRGEEGRRYRLVRPLGTPVRGKGCNVWLGLDDSNPDAEYIMKRPPGDQIEESWSDALAAFKHELEMQRLFAKDPMIRRLVDYVPESEPSGPMMVLEAFTDSLWDARNGVLLGIFTVHMKGLVYTVSKPSTREITSLTYRSPEVHFGKPWSSSTDVWSWGIILAQLLQAQVDFRSPGMYDSIQTGTLAEKGAVIRDQLAIDFDLSSVPFYSEDEQCARLLPTPQPEEAYMWANSMVEKGVSGEDIQFLVEVMNPNPDARLTVREILESGYLEI